MVGAFSIAFGAVYLYVKDKAKNRMITGRDFLDSQTIVGDLEISEQIPVRSYDYVLLPAKTITGKEIAYSRVDIDDSLGTLRTVPMRVGGSSALRPEAVDNLVRLRLRELKDIEDVRKGERKDKKKEEKKEAKTDGVFSRFRIQKVKEIPKVISEEGYGVGSIGETLRENVDEILEADAEMKKKKMEELDSIAIDDIMFDDDIGSDD
jgi:hypothetical protein